MSNSNHDVKNKNQRGRNKNRSDQFNRVDNKKITAPYNFVPLSDWVYFPDWGDQVNHDIPFKDGLNGCITMTIEAITDILVGGKQVKATDEKPGEVHFFQTPDGQFAIPGSSIKGMLRNVVEIISFSRLRQVDDRRIAFRDISSEAYKRRVINKTIYSGFIYFDKKEEQTKLVPCRYASFKHGQLETSIGFKYIFNEKKSVEEKYEIWIDKLKRKIIDAEGRIKFDYTKNNYNKNVVTKLFNGEHKGYPVLINQISDRRSNGKHKDHLFFDEESKAEVVRPEEWVNFLSAHDDEANEDSAWNCYWKKKFYSGEKVPVFYVIQEENDQYKKKSIGLAKMFKLASDYSIYDLIKRKSNDHLPQDAEHSNASDKSKLQKDFSDLLFGCTDETQKEYSYNNLKSRISIGLGKLDPDSKDVKPIEEGRIVIASQPKPSFFPAYLEQNIDLKTGKVDGDNYHTYMYVPENKNEYSIRGWKRYPTHKNDSKNPLRGYAIPNNLKKKNQIQTKLHALPTGTLFKSKIRFHNLRPCELGGLIWAIQWGGEKEAYHSLGMGKPYGMGQIKLSFDSSSKHEINFNHDVDQTLEGEDALKLIQSSMNQFESLMHKCYRDQANQKEYNWSSCPQLKHLLSMASIKRERIYQKNHHELYNMELKDFNKAKNNKRALIPICDGKPLSPTHDDK